MAFEKNFPKVSKNTLSQIVGEEYEGSTLTALVFDNGMKIERKFYVNFDEVAKQYFEYKLKTEPAKKVLREFNVPSEIIDTLSKFGRIKDFSNEILIKLSPKETEEYANKIYVPTEEEIQETKAGLDAIQNMYEPEGEPSYAYFNNEKIEIKGGFSMPMQTGYLQAFGPATTEGTKKPVADPLKEINNIITDTFKNPLIQAKKEAEKYEKKFNKVLEQARYWKGQYKLMSGYHDDELANVESYQKWYRELEFKLKQYQEKSESFQAANKILGETVERAAKLNSDMKIKLDRLEERLATELAKNFDLNFKSAIDRIKQQKDELKKRGKEIVELKESLEKLAIEEEKLEKENTYYKGVNAQLTEQIETRNETINSYRVKVNEHSEQADYWKNQADLWKKNSNEYQRFWEGKNAELEKLQKDIEAKDLLIETYEARKSADLESIKNLQAQNDRREQMIIDLKKQNKHDCKEHATGVYDMNVLVRVVCEKCGSKLWGAK